MRTSIPYTISIMKLLFGIGNPDKEYEGTRHNVGRAFAAHEGGYESDVFVNLSGPAVKKLKTKLKAKNEDIIIAHDDLDIEFGKFKLSFDRNSAGHKGVQSIIDTLKTNKFWRLRIGTSSPRLRSARIAGKVPEFVLSKFTPSEKKELPRIFKETYDRIADAR